MLGRRNPNKRSRKHNDLKHYADFCRWADVGE